MTTSHRMVKFKHRIHPHAPARIRGQTTVAAFQRANSLHQPEKQAYSQLQQLFSPSFPSSKISLPIQQDKILKDEIKTKQTQSKIPPPAPPTKQHKLVSSREKKKSTYTTRQLLRDHSSNLPTHKYIFEGEYHHFMGNEKVIQNECKKKVNACLHSKRNAINKALSKTDKSLLRCNIIFSILSCKQRAAMTFNKGHYWAGQGLARSQAHSSNSKPMSSRMKRRGALG